jgi:hypothetical protein
MTEILWTPGMTLEQIEKHVIIKAFRHYQSNKTATAKSLGISVRTLDTKLQQYDLEEKEKADKEYERRQEQEDFLARSRGLKVASQHQHGDGEPEPVKIMPEPLPQEPQPPPISPRHDPLKISIDHNKRRGR